jgi:acyl-CoA synthetase (AMP-forming)/AMP-acid ligase II
MRVSDPPLAPERIADFVKRGYWLSITSNDMLERWATRTPRKTAIVDRRGHLTYAEYHRQARRLAAHFVSLGLTEDDVIAVQLPNWREFPVAISGAMLAGIPFCQFHSDFRSREIEFILRFTEASVLIVAQEFRDFDYLAMIAELRPRLPKLKHVLVVGDSVPEAHVDLRRLLESTDAPTVDDATLLARRPHANALCRTAFTSGTTGDPKAVLHLHNTTNAAIVFLNELHRIGVNSVHLAFLPVGLNWGLFNVLQALFAGCTLVLQDIFKADETLRIIEHEKVTHFCAAPAHLVSLLNAPSLAQRDLTSLELVTTGGASCPIEVIRAVHQRLPGHLLELYGMLEVGCQCLTRLEDDPEEVCGLVGHSIAQMENMVVDDQGQEVPSGATGEILTRGPSVAVGYYNNPEASKAFRPDGWFHTGDLGVFDERGYLKIVGRKKEMLIRGGANIYPREIEEVLYQYPKVRDAAVVGVPDPRLGERVCACLVPRDGTTITFEEIVAFLRPKISTYKLPEFVVIFEDLPRTPTGKIQKTPLRELVVERLKGIAAKRV